MKENNFRIPVGARPLTASEAVDRIGGNAQIPMSPFYLSKAACEVKAAQLIASGQVKGMTLLGVAQEIFAHACAYYASSALVALGVDNATVNDIKNRASKVDITDGGDTPARQAAYVLIWTVTPSALSPV